MQGRWQRHRTAERGPASGFGDVLLYLEHSQTLFFRRRDQVWFYDSAEQRWRDARPAGPPPPFGIEATAAYDSRRQRVYLGGGLYPITPDGQNPLWVYDVAENIWFDLQPAGDPGGQVFNTHSAMLHYDSAADVLLLFRYVENKNGTRGIYAYAPDANRWRRVDELPNALWPPGRDSSGSSGFYYPPLGLHLFHVAGDSQDNGRILVYRYHVQQP